ncbi:hypothetical protein H9Y04_30575 [Streptomyces sp. TRM66268-LWL]|uniref:Uncharacterized protein n=1 Tax=Streptomyces polyasparticus TaxID=2767826 RepID=A0ABR7SN21_9ACTN|nr:hypothetical protein [Streptomyces polyasparticus]MBC9716886.1 hypothetical protein [Streptomyces polyasparticus]
MTITTVEVELLEDSREDPVEEQIERWATAHAQAAPGLGEEQIEILRELFQ